MAGKKTRIHWPLLIAGIPFTLIGLVALLLAGWPVINHLRAQHWDEHPATLEALYASHSPESRKTASSSRLEGRYRYQIGGREYIGERISFSIIRSNGIDDWDEYVRETLGASGNSITIRVNPANPAESVAIADIRWAEVGAALLFAGAMGGGGLALLAMAGADGRHPLYQMPRNEGARVRASSVILMWLLAPLFGTLVWLLWRDGHGFWAGLAALQPVLTANASLVYLRQRLR